MTVMTEVIIVVIKRFYVVDDDAVDIGNLMTSSERMSLFAKIIFLLFLFETHDQIFTTYMNLTVLIQTVVNLSLII